MSEASNEKQLDTGSMDTDAFRAFADREDEKPPKAVGVPFRLATLGAGLVALGLIAWLLLRL
ncbi:MAG: hypothetical protein ACRDZO_28810 [Egibacteraceae bacterium]